MEKFDVVVVGELNADLILHDIPSFPEIGKEKLAKDMTLTMGSASAILATNIARLGLKVGFMGKIGNDGFGKIVIDTLKDRHVDCSGIKIDQQVKTGITVVMSFPEDYAMLTCMGAMETFSLNDVDFKYIKRGKHMHLSSYYLQPALRSGCPELFKKAKELGMTTSFDPGWDPAEEWKEDIFDVLNNVDVLLPNEQEAMFISGKETIEKAMEKLNKHASTVVVTKGSQGSVCCTHNEFISAKVFKVDAKDTTGAGDSYNTGFLYKWLQGGDIKNCMIFGSACGAIATTKLGGTTASPTENELKQFLESHTENIIND
jgi:sugar/nucleoside kinase (ribokinase family)